jgi:glycerol-1-phosphate dehydrogenase [NAD(P)+]
MKMYKTPQNLNAYLDRRFECDCGRVHYAPLKAVCIGENALAELPVWIHNLGYQSVFLISDDITYKIAGRRCMELLKAAGIKAQMEKLTHLGFDEATVGELITHMPKDCDLLVAVGTGSINDMTRFVSSRVGRPFFTVATAAPMDGFASGIAAIYVNSMKTTFEAQTPAVIIGDTDILKNAPYRMIAAGLGDLLGKFTCLCDWKLSALINGEHYCPAIAELVGNCAQNVLRDAGKARTRDPQVIGEIMEGLVLSGVAMSLYGSSRSASGCEHHMSHFWEMIFEQRGKRPVPHGTQVSVGTVLVLKLVEALKKTKVDFQRARECAAQYDQAAWEAKMAEIYGPAAQEIILLEQKAGKNATPDRLRRIGVMEENWDRILELLNTLPSSEHVISLLKSLDAPYLPSQIDIDPVMLKNTFLYCKEVRARYTILQMVWDLGLLDELSDEVIAELNSEAEQKIVS